jgi:hypothetical protein
MQASTAGWSARARISGNGLDPGENIISAPMIESKQQ